MKKKVINKTIGITLVSALVLSLAACGDNGSGKKQERDPVQRYLPLTRSK